MDKKTLLFLLTLVVVGGAVAFDVARRTAVVEATSDQQSVGEVFTSSAISGASPQSNSQKPAQMKVSEELQISVLNLPALQIAALAPEKQQALDVLLSVYEKALNKAFLEYLPVREEVVSMVQAKSLQTPEAIVEHFTNFLVMEPELKGQVIQAMDIFETLDNDVANLKSGLNGMELQAFSEAWQNYSRRHVDGYHEFFTKEPEAIEAYDSLLRYYHLKRNYISYDENIDKLVFGLDGAVDMERTLILKINRLSRAQDYRLP